MQVQGGFGRSGIRGESCALVDKHTSSDQVGSSSVKQRMLCNRRVPQQTGKSHQVLWRTWCWCHQ